MKKRKRHTPEQIFRKLRKADTMLASGKEVVHFYQALEVSEATFHRWRNQYGGMKAEQAKRLKELDQENNRLKKPLAEAELDNAILKEALVVLDFLRERPLGVNDNGFVGVDPVPADVLDVSVVPSKTHRSSLI